MSDTMPLEDDGVEVVEPPKRELAPQDVGARPERTPGYIASRVVFIATLLFFTVLFIYPLIWLLSASLKPPSEVFSAALIGSEIRWSNYSRLFAIAPIMRWTWNSVLVATLAAISVTISSAMVAFAFSYFKFRFRDPLFYSVLATMMLPGAVLFIPQFLIWDALGFNNTLYPLWAGNLFGSAFYIFMLRQFFLTLPGELFEAAQIDGASYPRLWWSVALPLTKPALVVVFLLELKVAWTDLVRPLIFLRDSELFTLARGLKAIIDNPSIGLEQRWELLAAGSVIVTFPMVVIFFVFQRHFVEGIATTGITGK
ncbi:carbohydrate ABC transporter permease [Egicoccus sp. AB-alg6-2]|uniref:carbohydrate ABC transporter permease n=1 Tax=Egicoccus sp. AB-alg6-2 TaxID=3242692 RepID=UPI00359D76FB